VHMVIKIIPALLVVALGALVFPLISRMPPPYDDGPAITLSPSLRARFAGASNGPAFPADLSAAQWQKGLSEARLRSARTLFKGIVKGAESVAIAPDGLLLMLDKYGYLHTARSGPRNGLWSPKPRPIATTTSAQEFKLTEAVAYIGPGRPLGYHVVDNGRALLVCDSLKGLLHVDLTTYQVSVLSNAVGTSLLNYVNDVDIASDGMVYFSSSTAGIVSHNARVGFYDTMRSYLFNLMRGDASGRLLRYDPTTHVTSELASGLFFANGVALSAAEDFVAVVETSQNRVMRHWLRGPKAGELEVLIEKLPGSPDGITRSSDGHFWLSLVAPLSPLPHLVGGTPLWVRTLISHVILSALPYVAEKWGCVVKVSAEGAVLEVLMDPSGEVVSTVSAVSEHAGRLYLGNLAGDSVAVVDL